MKEIERCAQVFVVFNVSHFRKQSTKCDYMMQMFVSVWFILWRKFDVLTKMFTLMMITGTMWVAGCKDGGLIIAKSLKGPNLDGLLSELLEGDFRTKPEEDAQIHWN